MPFYEYVCLNCESKIEGQLTLDEYETAAVFETVHCMNPSPAELKEATICPRCDKANVRRYYKNQNNVCYIRGNGFLDRAGCHRDMNLHRLETEDPYAEMRQPGEVDDLKQKLKRAGQHNPNSKHFDLHTPADMAKAVKEATKN